MKKVLITVLLIVLVFSFTACGCEHEWTDATCLSPKICNLCGAIEGEPIEHNYMDANCENPKRCSFCNTTEGKALEHNYIDGFCTICYQKDPDYIDLNNYGFNNMYKKNVWVPIIAYNFSGNYVKVPTYNYRYLEFFGKYFKSDSGHPSEMISGSGQIEMKDPSVSTYSIIDNDVIEYNGASGVGPWMITERVVDGNRLIIKTLDETSLSSSSEWFVLADSLDLSNIVEGDEKGYYYIYFKL